MIQFSHAPGKARPETAADELAILRLLAVNELAITEDDADAYAGTYTDDATVSFWDAETHGATEIRSYFEKQQKAAPVRDVIVNVAVDVQGNRAVAIGTGIVTPSARSPLQILAMTSIASELVKDAQGVWRIARQSKKADRSFDPSAGLLSDAVGRLAERAGKLEAS